MKSKEVRKLTKTGDYTYYVTIPREFISELGWKKKQKVMVKRVGQRIIIEDWVKQFKNRLQTVDQRLKIFQPRINTNYANYTN